MAKSKTLNQNQFRQRNGAAKKISRVGKIRSKRRAPEDVGSLEEKVVSLAMSGKLESAARDAVTAQKRLGFPVTFKRGDQVIKVHRDGQEEILETLSRPVYRLPKGVRILK